MEILHKRIEPKYERFLRINHKGIKDLKLSLAINAGDWLIVAYIANWYFNPSERVHWIEQGGYLYCWVNFDTMLKDIGMSGLMTKTTLSKKIRHLKEKGIIATCQEVNGRLNFRFRRKILRGYFNLTHAETEIKLHGLKEENGAHWY
jgi:hypothetical protein